jgi:hypothetical protein
MNGFPPGFPGSGGGPFGTPPAYAVPQPPGQVATPNGPSAQPPGVQAHYCFSGSLECSGCNPCQACADTLKQYVIIPALLAEQEALGHDIQIAIQQGRPVDLQLLVDTFFRTLAGSWKQLHATMKAMPPGPQRPFRIINVTKVLEAAEVGRQVIVEREAAAAAAQAASMPSPPANVAMMPNIPPQNMAQPVSNVQNAPANAPVAPSHVIMPASSKPDFDRAMRAAGDVPPIITVQPEEPSSAPANGASRTVTPDDFAQAAPRANGAEKSSP